MSQSLATSKKEIQRENEPIGHQVQFGPTVTGLIEKLIGEVGKLNGQVLKKGISNEQPNLDEATQKMTALGQARGRPLNYPYIGSGAGLGPYVELEDGSIKMDLINGIGIHLFGHGHPRIMAAAVRGSLADIINQGNLQPNKEYLQFVETLSRLASKKSRMKHAWLATCGTMANESALKITRQKKSPARMVLAFKNAFAGRSTMMAELTDNPSYKVGLPEYHEMLRVPWYDKAHATASIETTLRIMKEHVAKHKDNISTFVFEPMLGEGGYQPAPREFFLPLLRFCQEVKIPVWADEVQTFTRTGEMFAYETLGIGEYIDLCTIAKTAQVGATIFTDEMNPAPGLIAGTFSGTSPALAAGLEILSMLENDGYLGVDGRVMKIHHQFIAMLNELNETTCKGLVQDAGGLGLMIAFTPLDGKKETVDKLLKKLFALGMIAFNCGKDPVRIRFLIPATFQDSDIPVAKGILEKAILGMKD